MPKSSRRASSLAALLALSVACSAGLIVAAASPAPSGSDVKPPPDHVRDAASQSVAHIP